MPCQRVSHQAAKKPVLVLANSMSITKFNIEHSKLFDPIFMYVPKSEPKLKRVSYIQYPIQVK